jgi:hypothetical protein
VQQGEYARGTIRGVQVEVGHAPAEQRVFLSEVLVDVETGEHPRDASARLVHAQQLGHGVAERLVAVVRAAERGLRQKNRSAMPRWSSTSIVRECRPPDRDPSRSWLVRRSTMTTSIPANTSSPADMSPVGPPPAITTACSVIATPPTPSCPAPPRRPVQPSAASRTPLEPVSTTFASRSLLDVVSASQPTMSMKAAASPEIFLRFSIAEELVDRGLAAASVAPAARDKPLS